VTALAGSVKEVPQGTLSAIRLKVIRRLSGGNVRVRTSSACLTFYLLRFIEPKIATLNAPLWGSPALPRLGLVEILFFVGGTSMKKTIVLLPGDGHRSKLTRARRRSARVPPPELITI